MVSVPGPGPQAPSSSLFFVLSSTQSADNPEAAIGLKGVGFGIYTAFRAWDLGHLGHLGFRVSGLGFPDSGFRVQGAQLRLRQPQTHPRHRMASLGFRVWFRSLGVSRVYGSGFGLGV